MRSLELGPLRFRLARSGGYVSYRSFVRPNARERRPSSMPRTDPRRAARNPSRRAGSTQAESSGCIRRRIERARRAAATTSRGRGDFAPSGPADGRQKGQRRAIVGGDAAGGGGPRLDLVPRAPVSNPPPAGSRAIDRATPSGTGGLACPLGAMGVAHSRRILSPQIRRDRGCIVGYPGSDRGSKSAWGNDRASPPPLSLMNAAGD